MTEMKPILFNTEMVRAILYGRKTCTRRVVKPQPKYPYIITQSQNGSFWQDLPDGGGTDFEYKPPYHPGDVLYVRETWQAVGEGQYIYRADKTNRGSSAYYNEHARLSGGWHPSIHMPKEAARIFLRVKSVRAERLQEIDGAGQRAEGADSKHGFGATRGAFMGLWNSTIKRAERDRYGWDANPWVWVIEFERCEKPEEKP